MSLHLEHLYSSHLPSFAKVALFEILGEQVSSDFWHVDVISDALQGCLDRGQRRLILNLPPRSLKSHCASVSMPVFAIGRNPKHRIMIVAGSAALARDLQRRALALLRTSRCRSLFPHLRPKEQPGEIVLPQGGGILYASVGQRLIGRGADIVIVDDPLSPSKAQDDGARTYVNEWYDAEVVPRLNDKASGVIIIVMQRLHLDDLTGHVRQRRAWSNIVLPAVALQDETWSLPPQRRLTRQKREPLQPTRESKDQLISILLEIGACNFSAQYLQNPLMNADPNRVFWYQSPRPPDWTPEMSIGPCGFYSVPEIAYILYDVFGEGNPPLRETSQPEYTPEEWSQSASIQQRRLMAKIQAAAKQ